MKKILILLLFCGFWANAQQYHDKGAKFENATSVGDTISNNTRIPIIDEFGLVNYYVDVADLLALNPAPVLEWGNITGTISDQTDLQGALNDKADQSALTAHTSNGSIHFTQSAISITESQVSDLKDYLRGDVNDTNGSNKLTLGSLEVVGQTTLQNGLNLTSIPVGTSDNILTLNQSTGDVEQRVFSLGDIDIANEAGVSQFPVGLGDQLRFEGSGDTSVSFDGVTNTVTITSVPGSGTGGAVTSFNGRTGGVVSQAGDYSTAMVNELTNLYFTEPRVRATPLTGLTVTNTPISSTNTFLQALGRLQGQINNREVSFSKNTAFNKNFGTSAGTVAQGNDSRINNGQTAYSWGNHASAGYVPSSRSIATGLHLSGGGNLTSNRTLTLTPTTNQWIKDSDGIDRMYFTSGAGSNGVILKASATGQQLQYRDASNTVKFYVSDVGSVNASGQITSADHITSGGILRAEGVGGGGNNVRINGTGTGNANVAYASFYESNGTTRQGYIGFNSTENGNLVLKNDLGNNQIVLDQNGGENGLQYNTGISSRTVWHSGNHRSNAENDNRYTLSSVSINAGLHLSGGGSLSADRSLTLTPTVDSWVLDSQGNQRMYFNSDAEITNGIILKASAATQRLQYRDVNNNQVFTVSDLGNVAATGTITGSNLKATGTSRQAGTFYTGSINPVSTNRTNYDGHLYVSNLTSIGDVIANSSSDKRLKDDIRRIENPLKKLSKLTGNEFKWNDKQKTYDVGQRDYGVLAQEVRKVLPHAVTKRKDGYLAVDYKDVIPLLIEAIKEQQIEIEELKTMINEK